MMMGTIIDIVILALCLLLGLRGLFNGFVREVLALVAFLAGFVAILYFGSPFAQWLVKQFSLTSILATIISFVLLFVVAYLVVKILESSLSRFVNIIMLSGLNRISGFLVGVLKGIIIIHLVILVIKIQNVFPNLEMQLNFSSSKLLPWVDRVSNFLKALFNI